LLQYADETSTCLKEAADTAGNGVPVLVNAWLDETDFREGSLSM